MVVNAVYTNGPVKIDTTVIGSCTSQGVPNANELLQTLTDGNVQNRATYISQRSQSPIFNSMALGQLLAITDGKAYNLSSGAGISFYYPSKELGSGRGAGLIYTMTDGLLVPTGISANHQESADLNYGVFPISSDGIVEAVIRGIDVAAPAADVVSQEYGLGPISITGISDLVGVQSGDVDFGNEVQVISADGDILPTFACTSRRTPSITVSGLDLDLFKASGIPINGLDAVRASTSIYFRKRIRGADAYVADGVAEHIKISLPGLVDLTELGKAEAGGDATNTLRISAHYDGTVDEDTMTIDTAAAIS